MNIVQQKLVKAYATLAMGKVINMDEVPKIKLIGKIEYPIRSEVEIEIAKRTIEVLG